jgi:DDE superfamily endonuclease
VKHQVVVVRKRKADESDPTEKRRVRIAAVSKSARGKTHDKKVSDESRTVIPRTASGIGDTGYVGTRLQVPHKKPKSGELTVEQKRSNRALSRRRIVAEHGIGKMKIWRIASDRYRNPLRRHTVMMKNVAGLHNAMFG